MRFASYPSLEDRVAFVTGGGSGISERGRGLALDVHERHAGSLGAQVLDDGRADPAAAARDEGDAILETRIRSNPHMSALPRRLQASRPPTLAQGRPRGSSKGPRRHRSEVWSTKVQFPSFFQIGILPPSIAMGIPLSLSVVLVPLAPDIDLDTIATVRLLVFAAGVGWFLWRHR